MLVDVIVVLEVAVAVVDVVHVIAMVDRRAAVSLGMRARVAVMDRLLRVVLAGVHVIDMVAVRDGLAPVPGVVLVIGGLGMRRHLGSSVPVGG